jgi:hypothetical protein
MYNLTGSSVKKKLSTRKKSNMTIKSCHSAKSGSISIRETSSKNLSGVKNIREE